MKHRFKKMHFICLLLFLTALLLSACGPGNENAANEAAADGNAVNGSGNPVNDSAVTTENDSTDTSQDQTGQNADDGDLDSDPTEPGAGSGLNNEPDDSEDPSSGHSQHDTVTENGTEPDLDLDPSPPATGSENDTSNDTDTGETESEPDDQAAAEPAANHTVEIVNFAFSPETLEIRAGDTVTFVNKDEVGHTATADDGSFDTGMLEQNAEMTVTFAEAGEFSYYCIPHPNMQAKIIVTDAN